MRTLAQLMKVPEKDWIVPRQDQDELVDGVVAILETSNHAYVEAPPAIGKTLVAALIANRLGHNRAYYIAHTVDLVDQAARKIASYRGMGLVRDDIQWTFVTRQRYANLATKDQDGIKAEEPLVFVDECHMGGVRQQQGRPPKVAFPAIVATAAKIVWISATPWDLDEDVMGEREGNTSQLSFDDAFKKNLLNDTDLIRVDCSLNIELNVAQGEAVARGLHKAEEADYVIDAADAQESYEALDGIVRDLAGRNLRTTDVPTLVRFRHHLMAQLYLERHKGAHAIFWLPTKQHARDCAAHINELVGQEDYAAPVLGETRGSPEAVEAGRRLADWRRQRGRTRVVCVVYRLREGFDHPPAALGFDCAWNPWNHRAAVQKIGRLTRTAKRKPTSLFYYAVDAVAIAAMRSRDFADRFLGRLGADSADLNLRIRAETFADAVALKDAFGADPDRQDVLPVIESVSLGSNAVTLARTRLFDMLSAKNTKERQRLSFREMMDRSANVALEKLVRDIETGKREYPTARTDPKAHNAIRVATSPSRPDYNPTIRARLVACGALKPRDDVAKEAARKLEALVVELEAGREKLGPHCENRRFLFKYISPVSSNFRPEVRNRLLAAGVIREGSRKGHRKSIVYTAVETTEASMPEAPIFKVVETVRAGHPETPLNTLRDYANRARRERRARDEQGPKTKDIT